MSHTKSVSLSTAYWAIQEVYGKEELQKVHAVFKQYGYPKGGVLELSQDTPGDGMVSLEYKTNLQGRPIQGVLRFAEDGSVYDGVVQSNRTLLPAAARLLIEEAFGSNELKNKPSEKELPFFQGAKEVYECHYQGSDAAAFEAACLLPVRQKIAAYREAEALRSNNQKSVENVLFAEKMSDIGVKNDDSIFSNWHKDVIKKFVDQYLPLIGAIPSDTVVNSALRLTKSNEMIFEIAQTWEGARACVELGKCESDSGSRVCDYGTGGYETFYLRSGSEKTVVRSEEWCPSKPDTSNRGLYNK